jgi:excisionase family DNA binding protein
MQSQVNAEMSNTDRERTKPYRVAEVAHYFDVDVTTVYREIYAGRLRALRIGSGRGTFRIPVSALAEYEARAAAPLAEVA